MIYISIIVNLDDKDQGLIICLLGVYYPLEAFGFLNADAFLRDSDNEDRAVEFAEQSMQQFEAEQQVRGMNG